MDKFTNTPTEIDNYVEILENQLYFAVIKGKGATKLKSTMDTFFFTIDDELIYENYYCDFGPLNISCLYKYCCKLNKYLQYAKGIKSVVHYTCSYPDKKANAACLMGSFCVIYLKIHPKEVWKILQEVGPYKPFLDASQCPCGFTVKIIDCMQALFKAIAFNFFNFEDFNVAEYDLHDKLQYGDMNWLVPRKFLAFIGPADNRTAHSPEFYIKYFLKNDVKTVIRLNTVIYNSSVFTQVGIQHFDLIFPDGTTPPKEILLKFLSIAEVAPAAIAVHCKAGLGRTGSLIGSYLIKHYRMTAKEAIAWMRICRPGSVIGQQQVWLEKIESWLWRTGSQYRVHKYGEGDKIPRHRYGIYSKQWPLEREKIIGETRKKIQRTFTKSQLEKISKQKRFSASVDSITHKDKIKKNVKKYSPNETNSYKSVSKLLSAVHGVDAKDAAQNVTVFSIDPLSSSVMYPQSLINNYSNNLSKNQVKFLTSRFDMAENRKYLKPGSEPASWKNVATGNKLTQVKERITTKNYNTQGDKLNEIKASRAPKYGDEIIPKLPYDTDSKQYPQGREKINRETRKQNQRKVPQSENISKQKTFSASENSIVQTEKVKNNEEKYFPLKTTSFKNISKLLSSVHGVVAQNASQNVTVFSIDLLRKNMINPLINNYTNDLSKNQMKFLKDKFDMADNTNYIETNPESTNRQDKITQVRNMITTKNYNTKVDKFIDIKEPRYDNNVITKEAKFTYLTNNLTQNMT